MLPGVPGAGADVDGVWRVRRMLCRATYRRAAELHAACSSAAVPADRWRSASGVPLELVLQTMQLSGDVAYLCTPPEMTGQRLLADMVSSVHRHKK